MQEPFRKKEQIERNMKKQPEKLESSGKLGSLLSIWGKHSLLGEQYMAAEDLGEDYMPPCRPLSDSRA